MVMTVSRDIPRTCGNKQFLQKIKRLKKTHKLTCGMLLTWLVKFF